MLAENFCSGVPLSRVASDGTFQYGEPLPTAQVYDRAIALFDSAMATAPNSARVMNAAQIGKARALLDKGDFSAAAAVAAQVPNNAGPYLVEYDAAAIRSENAVYQFNWDERRVSASLQEGTTNKGLPYGSNVDPRTPINPTPMQANSGTTPVYLQLKYRNGSADIPLATAYEARYIQAEAALRADQIAQFEQFLNQARALQASSTIPLLALTSAEIGTTQNQRIDTLFRERAYAMWLTGHRFSDMRRLIRQYNRPYAQVFPMGTAPNGEVYGLDASFPIPVQELNNPSFKGCVNFDA
jgi:tetratricopeptide (TPR) repeat protein